MFNNYEKLEILKEEIWMCQQEEDEFKENPLM